MLEYKQHQEQQCITHGIPQTFLVAVVKTFYEIAVPPLPTAYFRRALVQHRLHKIPLL